MLDPDHSVPFNVHAWSDSESIIALVDTVYASLPQKTLTKLVGTSNNTGSMSVKDIMRVVLVYQYSTWCCQTNEPKHQYSFDEFFYEVTNERHSVRAASRLSLNVLRFESDLCELNRL